MRKAKTRQASWPIFVGLGLIVSCFALAGSANGATNWAALLAQSIANQIAAGAAAHPAPVTPSVSPKTNVPTSSPATTSSSVPSKIQGNPFLNVSWYVNPGYASELAAAKAYVPAGSPQAKAIGQIAATPTFIWLDRIAAIHGDHSNPSAISLAKHVENAAVQSEKIHRSVLLPLVVYNVPDRDCAAGASNGTLAGEDGLAQYESEFIDVIVATLTADSRYAQVRKVIVLEPDSLPNLVTNSNIAKCAEAASTHLYQRAIGYAIQKLSSVPNLAIYLDIAHSGWLGWTNNLTSAVDVYSDFIRSATNGNPSLVRGFVTNVANYTPFVEPFVSSANQSFLQSSFYQWNQNFDELSYIKNLSAAFSAKGLPNFHFITDTSRNGWAPVNDGRPIDRRVDRGEWCNVAAGIGALPKANPRSDVSILDAFVWVKPPGESDGISRLADPNNAPDSEGKRFDPMCGQEKSPDSMSNAPAAGHFFLQGFLTLLKNAHPALH